METEVKKGIEMTPDLHRRMKTAAAARGILLKDATRQAFEGWLGGSQLPQYSSDEQKWLDRVLAILRSGNRRIVSYLQNDIARAEQELKSEHPQNTPGKRAG